jgi:hypothetical protein
MPGVGMIGIASRYTAEKSVSTAASLSPQVRTLNRMLALLPSSEEASCVMLDSLSALSSSSSSSSSLLASIENRLVRGIHKKLVDIIPVMVAQQSKPKSPAKKKAACKKGVEIMEMAQAVDRAFQTAFGKDEDRKSAYNVFVSEYAKKKHATKNARGGIVQLASEAWKELSSSEKDDYEGRAERMNRKFTEEHCDSVYSSLQLLQLQQNRVRVDTTSSFPSGYQYPVPGVFPTFHQHPFQHYPTAINSFPPMYHQLRNIPALMQQGGPARNVIHQQGSGHLYNPYLSTDLRGPGLVALATDPQDPYCSRVEERARTRPKV